MKQRLEILDPVKDFYRMRKKRKFDRVVLTTAPIMIGIFFLVLDALLSAHREFLLDNFVNDFLNQIITMLTLFISFSMAYLSIIITSSNENMDKLRRKDSEEYFIGGKACTLYQVLMNEITYTLIFEIFFLLVVLFQKFAMYLMSNIQVKYLIAITISFFAHTLFTLLITIKDIYFSFWN